MKEAFGIHGRAAVFNGDPNYENIVSEEASGKHISRLPNTSQEQGKALVLGVSHDFPFVNLKSH